MYTITAASPTPHQSGLTSKTSKISISTPLDTMNVCVLIHVCVYLSLLYPHIPHPSYTPSPLHLLTPPTPHPSHTPLLPHPSPLPHPSHTPPHPSPLLYILIPSAQAPHRVMHNLSGAGGGSYPTSLPSPTQVDSTTSVTTALSGLSGLSGHSINGTDVSPERAAQSK